MLPPRNTPAKAEWLETLLRHSHRRQYPAKTTIIHHGDKPDTLYYMVDGSVSVVIEDDEGREIVLAYLNNGDFFGEMGLFEEDSERSAWVVALQHVCVRPAPKFAISHSLMLPVASHRHCLTSPSNQTQSPTLTACKSASRDKRLPVSLVAPEKWWDVY